MGHDRQERVPYRARTPIRAATAEEGQLERRRRCATTVGAGALEQVAGGGGGATGGQDVVDDQHPLPRLKASACTSIVGGAVLQVVRHRAASARAACRPCAPARSRCRAAWATAAPTMKPRASMPTTRSTLPAYRPAMSSTTAAKACAVGEQRREVLEEDPGCGKSGMSRSRLRPGTDRLRAVDAPSAVASGQRLDLGVRRGWLRGPAGVAGDLCTSRGRCGVARLGARRPRRRRRRRPPARRRVARAGRAPASARRRRPWPCGPGSAAAVLSSSTDRRLAPAQVDQQRRGDEDRGVGADRDADEQRQREVEQRARAEAGEADDEDRGDRQQGRRRWC